MRILASFLFILALAVNFAGAEEKITPPKDAEKIKVPEYQGLGQRGARHELNFSKPGDTVWLQFELEDKLVILLRDIGSKGDKVRLDLFDSKGKPLNEANWIELGANRTFNGKLAKGTYFIRTKCVTTSGKPVEIELYHYSKKDTAEAEKNFK